jgi:hypothetical protein
MRPWPGLRSEHTIAAWAYRWEAHEDSGETGHWQGSLEGTWWLRKELLLVESGFAPRKVLPTVPNSFSLRWRISGYLHFRPMSHRR